MILYKYQGAGNDFLVADNRDGKIHLTAEDITALCDRRYGIGADGVMLLEQADAPYDFRMVYYNSDGSGGMMCGNGGRCIVAFAYFLDVPARQDYAEVAALRAYHFIAADGPHTAQILSSDGKQCEVRLGMKDVSQMRFYDQDGIRGCFLDTGTRHLVCMVPDVKDYDVYGVGRTLRYRAEFGPIGVNVNFIERKGDTLWVRTYEKGVEDETYACGTGITASAIAAWHYEHGEAGSHGALHQSIQAVRDSLSVDFVPTAEGAKKVYLTGPATYVAKVEV